MRRAVALFVLLASALWAAPARAQVPTIPYDYERGLANRYTGLIATVDVSGGPGVGAGPGAVGIRRVRGPGTVVLRAELSLARSGVNGSTATLCLRVVDAGTYCGTPLSGGQVSPDSWIQAEFFLPSARTWEFEVFVGANRGSAAGATTYSVAWVRSLTVTG